nr:heterogeneous nuclear ribonucleoprotein R-like isoform X1 [Ipomoea batatas]
MLVFCDVPSPHGLWMKYKEHLCEDLISSSINIIDAENKCLHMISDVLESLGKNINDFALVSYHIGLTKQQRIQKEIKAEKNLLPNEADLLAITKLNQSQRAAFDTIIAWVYSSSGGVFFVDGPGGTGKTFLYSIGPELTREYRKKLYSNLGLLDLSFNMLNEEYEQKEPVDEYEKGERLDLEDNDPEYETEEYGGPDYDDRGIEYEEVQEEGEEIEEHEEEYIGDEGEGDMVEEEVEDVNEDLESEEDDDHVGEEHGQMVDEAEEDEHDEVVKERRKRKELEIFIGGLDKDATEDDLRKVLSEVGDVTEVRFMMNPQTMKNKGFAFLRFTTVEQASL